MLKTPKIKRLKKEQSVQVHHEQPSVFIIDMKKNAVNTLNKIHHDEISKIECLFFSEQTLLVVHKQKLRETHVAMVSMFVLYKAKIGNVRKAK